MRVLGIDPGTATTGYGIVEVKGSKLSHIDNGGIRPSAKLTLPLKLKEIHNGVLSLIKNFKPDIVAIENVFFAKNVHSSLILGHARGAAMLAASISNLTVTEYSPLEVKKAIVGTGGASKHQVQQMVKIMLSLPEIAFEDASDALAIAICHCNTSGLKDRIEKSVSCR